MDRKCVDLVIGGQYGSEGKGKVCGYIAPEYDIAVRVGGPNAGHTVWVGDKDYKLKQLPVAGIVNPDCLMAIGAGGLIHIPTLFEEMKWINDTERVIIDPNAGILEEKDSEQEKTGKLFEAIGSTNKGVGAALARKVIRKDFRTAKDVPELQQYVSKVTDLLFAHMNSKETKIMIEGTQGFSLSLNHGPYPFCTSRDCLASSLLSDVGLPPSCVNETIMVIRTYPIRVFGNSGPMYEELSWEEVTRLSGSPEPLLEKTTVTQRVRRVGKFDWDQFADAVDYNDPTSIAIMFIDYIDYGQNHGATTWESLSRDAKDFVERIEQVGGVPVSLIGTGPKHHQMIERS